ncbi:DnaJ family domain-containing protein [Niallia sp. 03133]|uniref:DnaJ family domain-containing protein n=1 Tax=Niallia sp. 03133 TaxID=3458060 RepID=UPI0040450E3E
MDFSSLISEEKIKKAYKNGEFKNLPGFGKPLPKDDLAAVPEELRMAYRVLKNAGFNPEENQLRQELLTIEDLIKTCCDKKKEEELQKKYNEKLLRFNKMMKEKKGSSHSASFQKYQHKIENKLWKR